MITEAFQVREFRYRDGEPVDPFWGLVVSFGDEERVIFETTRHGVAKLKLVELRKLLCDEASEWRSRLPQGVDAELGLWTFARPLSRKDAMAARAANRKRGRPEWQA